MDFEQLLAAASTALSAPDSIVGRSARARATADGVAPEQILAQWAGVDAGTASEAAPAAAPPSAEAAAPEPPAAPGASTAPELDVEVVGPTA